MAGTIVTTSTMAIMAGDITATMVMVTDTIIVMAATGTAATTETKEKGHAIAWPFLLRARLLDQSM